LALGERIVRELKIDPRGDTLNRWLAHHLAELMLAEKAASDAERPTVQAQVVDVILRVWGHRHNLPGDVHPLKKLDGILRVMRLLDTGAWPYYRQNSEFDLALAQVFNGLKSIVIHGAVLSLSGTTDRVNAEGAYKHLDEQEREILELANNWLGDVDNRVSTPVIILHTEEEAEAYEAEKAEEERIAALSLVERSKARLRQNIETTIGSLESLLEQLSVEGDNEEQLDD